MDAARRDSATSVVHPSDASSGLPRNHTADFRIDFARPFDRQLFRQPSRGWQHFPRKSVESPPDKLRSHTDLAGHHRKRVARDLIKCPRAANRQGSRTPSPSDSFRFYKPKTNAEDGQNLQQFPALQCRFSSLQLDHEAATDIRRKRKLQLRNSLRLAHSGDERTHLLHVLHGNLLLDTERYHAITDAIAQPQMIPFGSIHTPYISFYERDNTVNSNPPAAGLNRRCGRQGRIHAPRSRRLRTP